MLQSIRDRTQGWIAGVIISLLILSFALWGIHSYVGGGGGNATVAVVNRVDISANQYRVTYERLRRQMQMQMGTANLSSQDESQLRRTALNTLINMEVLKQASFAHNYRISTQQVDAFLENMPALQVNGKFSEARFQQLLNVGLFTASDFIDLIRSSLLIEQPRLGILLSSFALPNEVANSVALINQKRSIQYLILPLTYFLQKDIVIPEKSILDYYEQHKQDFQNPEQVSVEYIQLSTKQLAASIQPTENDLRKFYEDSYAADANNKNKQTTTVQLPYEKVKDKIKADYIKQQAETKFLDLKEKLANLTYEHPESLTIAAKELNLPIQVTDKFIFANAKGKDPITSNPNVRNMAFSSDVLFSKNNSDVVLINPSTAIVLRIKEHIPAEILPLTAVKNQITTKLKLIAAEEQTTKLAEDLRQKLASGENPQQLAQQYHLTWNKADLIERHAKQIDPAILFTAYRLPKPENNTKSYYAIVKMNNGYGIVTTQAVQDGSVAKNQNDIFAEQVQNSEGLLEYELYQQSLMQQAKIKITQSQQAD